MMLVRLLLTLSIALLACGGDDDDDTTMADSGGASFQAPVCVDPTTATMTDNIGVGGLAACLDTGSRGAGICPGNLHPNLCPPNISIEEVAIFVKPTGGQPFVIMRAPVTFASAGTIDADGLTVRAVTTDQDVTIEAQLAAGARLRVVFRLSGSTTTIVSFDHEAPL